MSIKAEKDYLVLNKTPSAVAVSTRDGSHLIPGGTTDEPGTLPFTITEIQQINANSPVFKIGVLWFEDEYADDIYTVLRIREPEKILTDEVIDDIIMNPSAERLQMLVDITNAMYFERVYGRYVGLKNLGCPISQTVANLIVTRHSELRKNKLKTSITINATKKEETTPKLEDKTNEALKQEVEALKQMVAKLLTLQATAEGVKAEPAEKDMTDENVQKTSSAQKKPSSRKATPKT